MDLPAALAQVSQRRESPFTLAWVKVSRADTVDVLFVDESTATVPKLRSYNQTNINDVVIILRHAGAMYCIGALNSIPVPPPTPDPDDPDTGIPPAPTTRTQTFRPIYTGTWRAGGWLGTTDLYQGAAGSGDGNNLGAAYYGDGPAGLESASAISGTVRVRRINTGNVTGQRPTLQLLPESVMATATPPEGYAQIAGPVLLIDQTVVVNLPTSWVTDLLTGAAGGIGIATPNQATAPYLGLAGRSTWSAAMELTLTYRPDPTT